MLTALLLLGLIQSAPSPSAPAVKRPALELPAPDWAFVPLPSWQGPTRAVASLMFAVGIDPTVEPESEERADLDVYESE